MVFSGLCAVFFVLLLSPRRQYKYAQYRDGHLSFAPLPLLHPVMTQAPPLFSTRYQLAPPLDTYFTFSIDVEATLDLYCDGGDEVMKEKLDGIQNRQYAGYCTEIVEPDEEQPKYHVINIRPVQQRLTKPHSRKPQHARPTMCVPVYRQQPILGPENLWGC
ncbi:hypothetical protein ARMGADRAFT_144517 [Armillaria gallica]|uniref:Uncharacterized protein n=1 Tax=Armillaria gallica TaxID=47427 RepID=A0A2H3DFU5_ARMGA|nr:hypothetical protein ARMGADRAFT_144517 [Armillaria gallica]